MKIEEETQNFFVQENLKIFLGLLYHDAIQRKTQELFGTDSYAYLNKLIETKQGIDPAKINALQEYIKELSEVFKKTHEII